MERSTLQHDVVLSGQVVDAPAKDVVFRHHFFDVKAIIQALLTVSLGAFLYQRFRNGLVRVFLKRFGQLSQQVGNVIVERGRIQVLGCRQGADLFSPARQQRLAVTLDKCSEFVQIRLGHIALRAPL